MGAAIAFYTVFSLAPMLVIVIAVAGLVFGREAAEGALFSDLTKLVGPESAGAVQAMLRSASSTRSGLMLPWSGLAASQSNGRSTMKNRSSVHDVLLVRR
jgi:membrane protein